MQSAKQFVRERFVSTEELPPVSLAVVGATLLLWVALFDGWLPMPAMSGSMSMTMSDPGVPEGMATANGLSGALTYLLMWGVMMSAMMYPAMLPFVRRYAESAQGTTGEVARGLGYFLGTYSLVWLSTGVVPLAFDAVVDVSWLVGNHGRFALGGMLLVAGLYQLTDEKRESLRTCCARVPAHEPRAPDAIRRGIEHGLSCVRCTWALFAFMVFVGSMNFFWMLLLTTVVTLERFAPRAGDVATTVGVAAVVGGVLTLLFGVPAF
jgi:predicted metal-binding membrane protein